MEHIIIKELANGFVQLTAAKGYKLFSIRLNRTVSEAVVLPEDVKDFKAVKK